MRIKKVSNWTFLRVSNEGERNSLWQQLSWETFLLHITQNWVFCWSVVRVFLKYCTLSSNVRVNGFWIIFSLIVHRFSALASHYKDFHLFDFNDEYLDSSEERLNPTAKRIAEGWLTYSLVEMKQRYNIPGKGSNLIWKISFKFSI